MRAGCFLIKYREKSPAHTADKISSPSLPLTRGGLGTAALSRFQPPQSRGAVADEDERVRTHPTIIITQAQGNRSGVCFNYLTASLFLWANFVYSNGISSA